MISDPLSQLTLDQRIAMQRYEIDRARFRLAQLRTLRLLRQCLASRGESRVHDQINFTEHRRAA